MVALQGYLHLVLSLSVYTLSYLLYSSSINYIFSMALFYLSKSLCLLLIFFLQNEGGHPFI